MIMLLFFEAISAFNVTFVSKINLAGKENELMDSTINALFLKTIAANLIHMASKNPEQTPTIDLLLLNNKLNCVDGMRCKLVYGQFMTAVTDLL